MGSEILNFKKEGTVNDTLFSKTELHWLQMEN